MLTDTIGEEDGELEEDLSLVLNTSRPFADNVHGRQIEHFEKGFISRKNAFTLCDFSKLTVVTLDHVRRVDKLTDLRRILEEGGDLWPAIPLGQYPNWQNQKLHLTAFQEITLDGNLTPKRWKEPVILTESHFPFPLDRSWG